MRASQFLVLSDSTFLGADGAELRVLLHSRSGQVYLLAESVLRRILCEPQVLAADVVEELATAGLLVDDGYDEFSAVVRENAATAADTGTRTFVLMPSSYCNMGCGYCGQRHFRSAQSRQHRDAVKGRVLHAVDAAATTGVQVNWFGGEPMLGYAQILDISAAVIPACATAGVHYSAAMVTNGSLLTPNRIRTLHLECRVGSFEITLDGPGTRHEAQRPLRNGRPSFDRIVGTIREACLDPTMPDLTFTIRTNISRVNQNDHDRFAGDMKRAGLDNPRVRFYTALVRPWGNDVSGYAVPGDQVVAVEEQWLRAYREHGLATTLLPTARTRTVCVAVSRGSEVIEPTGNVHSCTEQPLVPGRESTALGHVADLQTPAVRPEGRYDRWNEELLGETDAHCPACSIFPICGGHCPLVWHSGGVACPSLKYTMPMRLTMYGESLGLPKTVPPPVSRPSRESDCGSGDDPDGVEVVVVGGVGDVDAGGQSAAQVFHDGHGDDLAG